MNFESKSQKGFQMIKKSIAFVDKFDMPFRHVENHYKTNDETRFLKSQKTRCGNPYKTCQKWKPFEPKTQKGFQNDQKAASL